MQWRAFSVVLIKRDTFVPETHLKLTASDACVISICRAAIVDMRIAAAKTRKLTQERDGIFVQFSIVQEGQASSSLANFTVTSTING